MAERRTSVAKEVLEQKLDNALERYGELTNNFDQAQNAEQSLEITQVVEKPYTGTSAARDILEQRADKLLERYGETSQEFNNAHDNFQEDDGQGRNSSMVTDDKASHELKPDQSLSERDKVDRLIFNERWQNERQEAQQDQQNDGQDLGR